MSIKLSNEPSGDAICNGREVLGINLGPPLDGAISLGQLCAIAGITLNGEKPPIPAPAEMCEEPWLDLSGATSFFDLRYKSTKETATAIVDAILSAQDDAYLIEHTQQNERRGGGATLFSDASLLNTICPTILIGRKPTSGDLAKVSDSHELQELFPALLILEVAFTGFQFPLRHYSRAHLDSDPSDAGRNIKIAGHDAACLYDTLSVKAAFASDDGQKRNKLQRIAEQIVSFFPELPIEATDLKNGRRLPELDTTERVDRAIASWVQSDDENWLRVSIENINGARSVVGFRSSSLQG